MNRKFSPSRFRIFTLLLGLILAACQPAPQPAGEGVTPTAAAVSTAAVDVDSSPAPETLPETGALDELQPVIAAILSGDLAARRALVRFTTTACTNAGGLGGPPKCLAGEEEGATVEAFPVSSGEGTFARPEDIDQTLDFQVDNLYAVYRVPEGVYEEDYWPAGEYGILFEHQENGNPVPVVVLVEDGRIVRLDYLLGQTAAGILEGLPAGHILLSSDEVEKWLESAGLP